MNKKTAHLPNLIPLSLHPVGSLENISICEEADKANLSKVLFLIIWHSCQILVRSSQLILSLLSTFMLLCWELCELCSNGDSIVQEGKYRLWPGTICSRRKTYVDKVCDSGWLELSQADPLPLNLSSESLSLSLFSSAEGTEGSVNTKPKQTNLVYCSETGKNHISHQAMQALSSVLKYIEINSLNDSLDCVFLGLSFNFARE